MRSSGTPGFEESRGFPSTPNALRSMNAGTVAASDASAQPRCKNSRRVNGESCICSFFRTLERCLAELVFRHGADKAKQRFDAIVCERRVPDTGGVGIVERSEKIFELRDAMR